MAEALRVGRKALPKCRPNPPVGCVLVFNGKIVSSGYTQAQGEDHAEAMAIKACPLKDFSKVTAFVTLEPCSFAGRTPSCAKLIIDKGIKKVMVAIADPHPKNKGRGLQLMREAGISVHTGVLEKEARMDLQDYLIYETVEANL